MLSQSEEINTSENINVMFILMLDPEYVSQRSLIMLSPDKILFPFVASSMHAILCRSQN